MLASHALPQSARLFKRAFGVMREIRRDFQTHIAIVLFCLLVNGGERGGGILNVTDGEKFITGLGIEIRAPGQRIEEILILPASDGFFKNRGIGGHAAEAVLVDQTLQFSARHQIAANVVEPDGLPKSVKLDERIYGFCSFKSADWIHKR